MGYCTYITKAGYELQAKLFAEGGEFRLTRVEVGRGVCPAETDPSALTGLVEPMAQATSTKPVRVGCEVSLSVEYRSDLNGGLEETFQINEFGVFAVGVDGDGAAAKYDLDGVFVTTWGVLTCEVKWDMTSRALVVRSADGGFAGDLLVMGRADTSG